jgi:hypothetical protein
MKNKKFVLLSICILAILVISSYAETKKIYRLGVHPLMKKGVISADELKKVVWKYDQEIMEGFKLAGQGDLYLDFMNLIEPATFTEKTLPTGTKIAWMLYKPGWKVRVDKDLEWAADKPLEVFAVTLNRDCTDYHFVIPKKCGNISLLKAAAKCADCDLKITPEKANVGDPITIDMSGTRCAVSMEVAIFAADGTKVAGKTLTPAAATWETTIDKPGEYTVKGKAFNPKCDPPTTACKAKVFINAPPVCCVKVLSEKNYVKKPVIVDASCSSDPDGEIVEAAVVFKDEAGKVLKTKVFKEKPFKCEPKFDKPGIVTVCVKMRDDFGGTCESCDTKVEIKGKPFFPLVAFAPGLAKGTYSGYLFGRLGIGYWAAPDTLALTLSGGYAQTLAGEPFKSFGMASFLLNLHTGPFYIGGGLGLTSQVRDPDWDGGLNVVGNVGYDIFKTVNSTGSIFGELRVAVGDDYEFSEHHMFLLGFRYIFSF